MPAPIGMGRLYDYRDTGISDRMGRQGEIAAQGALRSGEIWGRVAEQLGQIGGRAVQEYGERKEQSKRDAALMQFVQSGAWQDPKAALAGSIKILGPREGPRFAEGLIGAAKMHGAQNPDDARAALPMVSRGLLAAPESMRPGLYGQARQLMLSAGIASAESMPEQWTPELLPYVHALAGQGGGAHGQATTERVKQNGVWYERGADGAWKQAAGLPTETPEAPKPAAVGSFEDYVVQKFGPRPTPDQIKQARREYGQADDRAYRPIVPVVIQTAEGPQLLDRSTGKAQAITGASGDTISAAPTQEQRNRAASRTTAIPVLDAVAELSERINTQQGVIAKIAGAAERAKAQANLSDDVSEYQAVVSGFTPLLARMVGHTGVLTEQDVQSVRAMLPRPEDSKSIRDRKIDRIRKILSAQPGGGAAPAGKPAAPPPLAKGEDALLKKYGY